MCARPLVAAPAAVTPLFVGKYRRCGRVPSTLRWCGAESTNPRLASLPRRSLSVEAGTRPKRDRSSTGHGRGAQQQERPLKALAQVTQGRVRPQALQVDDDL